MAVRSTKVEETDDVETATDREQTPETSRAFPSRSVPMQLGDDKVAIVRAAIVRNRKVCESLANR